MNSTASRIKGFNKRHFTGAIVFVLFCFLAFHINYARFQSSSSYSTVNGIDRKTYLVVIGTKAEHVSRRSHIRSSYFDIQDNLIPVDVDSDRVQYRFLVHGGPPASNTPERRAFETEKMEYNDIYTLPSSSNVLNPGTVFHWIDSTKPKAVDYVILQDVHSFISLNQLLQQLDSSNDISQLGTDEKGLVVSWARYKQLLLDQETVADNAANTLTTQTWKNSIESVNTNSLLITDIYQDRDFLDIVDLYRLKPVINKPTAKSIAVVTSSYIYDQCMEPSGTKASLNKRSYADKHGYAFVARSREFAQQSQRPDQRRTVWGKIDVIQKVLAKYDWIFWLDMDAVVMNSEQSLEALMDRVLLLKSEFDFVVVRPGTDKMINAGVFLIKNTPWSFQFLEEIQDQQGWYRQGPSYEQGAMWDVMQDPKHAEHIAFLDRENHLFNTFPKFYQQDDFIVHFAPDKCPNSATLKGLAAADRIKQGQTISSKDLI